MNSVSLKIHFDSFWCEISNSHSSRWYIVLYIWTALKSNAYIILKTIGLNAFDSFSKFISNYLLFSWFFFRRFDLVGFYKKEHPSEIWQLFGSRVIIFAIASNYNRFIFIIFKWVRPFMKHVFAPRWHHTCPN